MDEHEEKERFRRAFSPLRASGGVLTEVFEMTTRKERRAPRAGKRLLVFPAEIVDELFHVLLFETVNFIHLFVSPFLF